MPKMQFKVEKEYAQVMRQPGDIVDVEDRDVTLLETIGWAEAAPAASKTAKAGRGLFKQQTSA